MHRYPRKRRLDLRSEERRESERRLHAEKVFNDLWRTVPGKKKVDGEAVTRRRALLDLPQENILYFLEKTAPRLHPWQREILRIVRLIAQYFYPQAQTKMMNEGCATYCHYRILTRLHETGRISDGAFFEFLTSHTNVITQPGHDDPRFNGINPYALGFAMMCDIERVVTRPSDEDRAWFPDLAGRGEPFEVLKGIWTDYRDESFVSQFLSPTLMRQWRMFHILDDGRDDDHLVVDAIHDERGYRRIRRALARQYDRVAQDADIQVVDVDLAGDRRLVLQHAIADAVPLNPREAQDVLQHLADLWSYDVLLRETDPAGFMVKEYVASPKYMHGLRT